MSTPASPADFTLCYTNTDCPTAFPFFILLVHSLVMLIDMHY